MVPPDLPPEGSRSGVSVRINKKTYFQGLPAPRNRFLVIPNHFKNMIRICQKPVFRGWYPLIYLLQGLSGGLTLCVSLLSSSCTKMRTFVKNWRSLSSKTWTGFSKNHFSGGGTPWFTPFRGSDPKLLLTW